VLRLKYTEKWVAQHCRNSAEKTKKSEWGNKTWTIPKDKCAPAGDVMDFDRDGAQLLWDPMFSLSVTVISGKSAHGCVSHGSTGNQESRRGVSRCLCAVNTWQSLTVSQPTFNLALASEQPYSAPALLFES